MSKHENWKYLYLPAADNFDLRLTTHFAICGHIYSEVVLVVLHFDHKKLCKLGHVTSLIIQKWHPDWVQNSTFSDFVNFCYLSLMFDGKMSANYQRGEV